VGDTEGVSDGEGDTEGVSDGEGDTEGVSDGEGDTEGVSDGEGDAGGDGESGQPGPEPVQYKLVISSRQTNCERARACGRTRLCRG
jgi:hypothetical protein